MFENPAAEGDKLQILQSDLDELAKDYSKYLQVDASKEVRDVTFTCLYFSLTGHS